MGRCRRCGTEREFFTAAPELRKMTKPGNGSISAKLCKTCNERKRLTLANWPRHTYGGGFDDVCRECRLLAVGR